MVTIQMKWDRSKTRAVKPKTYHERSLFMDWKFVFVLIFSLLVAIFTMQNAEAVDVRFLTFEFTQVSQALVILISAVAGALIALLLGAIRWVRDKSKLMSAKKSIAGLDTQVKQLRIMLDAEIAKNSPTTIVDKEESPIHKAEQPIETQGSDSEPIVEKEKDEELLPKRKWYQI
jgi:lipopolysaccharide assembly protein A